MTSLLFSHRVQETDTVYSAFFQPEKPIDYIAGQFIELYISAVPSSDRQSREFTITSAPHEEYLQITYRYHTPASAFKYALHHLKAGDRVQCSAAMGDFVLPIQPTQKYIMIAGGVGLTPIRSMILDARQKQQTTKCDIYHISKDADKALFANNFLRKHAKELRALTIPADNTALYYISGPEGFVANTQQHLTQLGKSPWQIITDSFLGYKS